MDGTTLKIKLYLRKAKVIRGHQQKARENEH
jgi:hypothetical protein